MVMATITITTITITTTRMIDRITLDAASLLRLMWLASPALPVGAFAYSEGLESAVDAGLVRDETTAADWLCDQLDLVVARCEMPAVAEAMQAFATHDTARAAAVDDWVLRTRESAEQRAQTLQMGRSLVEWLRHGEHRDDARLAWAAAAPHPTPTTWPVAFALAATLARLDPTQALLAHAFGWCEAMAQAAIKAVPLGQAAAQRVLTRLAHAIPSAVDHALALPADERQAFAPMLAVLSARHETQYTRIFRS